MLEGVRARLRPGSKGEAVSKVDTSGQGMASTAAQLRSSGGPGDTGGPKNWPVGLLAYHDEKEQDGPAKPIPYHAPDDAGVVNRLFRLDIKDI